MCCIVILVLERGIEGTRIIHYFKLFPYRCTSGWEGRSSDLVRHWSTSIPLWRCLQKSRRRSLKHGRIVTTNLLRPGCESQRTGAVLLYFGRTRGGRFLWVSCVIKYGTLRRFRCALVYGILCFFQRGKFGCRWLRSSKSFWLGRRTLLQHCERLQHVSTHVTSVWFSCNSCIKTLLPCHCRLQIRWSLKGWNMGKSVHPDLLAGWTIAGISDWLWCGWKPWREFGFFAWSFRSVGCGAEVDNESQHFCNALLSSPLLKIKDWKESSQVRPSSIFICGQEATPPPAPAVEGAEAWRWDSRHADLGVSWVFHGGLVDSWPAI